MFKIISIDDEKESISGYDPKDANKFHEESAKNANKKFDQELKKLNDQQIVLMCGGSASGKTEFIAKFLSVESKIVEDDLGLVFDSTTSNISGVEIKIRNIEKSRNIAVLYLVLPYSLTRCFTAFNNRERKIPEDKFFQTHSGARQVAIHVAQNYLNVEIKIFYNRLVEEIKESGGSVGKSKIHKDDVEFEEIIFDDRAEMIKFLKKEQYSEQKIKELIMDNR